MTDSNGNGQKDNPADTAKAAEPVVSKPYIMPDDPEEGSVEALTKEAAELEDDKYPYSWLPPENASEQAAQLSERGPEAFPD